MAGITGDVTEAVLRRLRAHSDGVTARVVAMEQADSAIQVPGIKAFLSFNATPEVSEKTGHGQYPAVFVYCDKLSNVLKEKFRRFSGRARMVVEIRHSQDKIETLGTNLQVYADAVCALLDEARGDWGGGGFYAGGYDVSYEPAARGGRNFVQRTKVVFDVEVSR